MNSPDKNPQEKSPKKPYRSPVLEVYGDIRAITKAVGLMGMGDGGGGLMTKTG
jgi:hypothetical protein